MSVQHSGSEGSAALLARRAAVVAPGELLLYLAESAVLPD